jgi:translocation and assembly module TamA
LVPAALLADVAYVIDGVDETLKSNVLSHVDTVQFGPQVRLHAHDHEVIVDKAIRRARQALRPFGYYAPTITGEIVVGEDSLATVRLNIDPGPPVRVAILDVRVTGPGAKSKQFRAWRKDWPLPEGSVLDHETWEKHKQNAIEISNARGYLNAEFTEHALEIDLEQNTAVLKLALETGPRFVMGDVHFGEHMLKPGILEYVQRFNKGDPYTARLVSLLRTDLWKLGYFDDVQVLEVRRPDLEPPAVDFDVAVVTETRDSYQGALGYGTDTGFRLQAAWSKRPVSSSGARIDIGIGYQEQNDQATLRGRYQRPILDRAREWWDTELTLRLENLDLEVRRSPEDDELIKIANGDLTERHIRFGRLKLRNQKSGERQQFDTLFVQYLNSERRFGLPGAVPDLQPLIQNPEFESRLKVIDNAFSIGVDVDIINVEGRQFETVGNHDRVWAFHSDKAFGSEVEFTQLYAATRRSYVLGERLKFHTRAEVGYTDADVDEFELDIGGDPLILSLTKLPNFYRFKAGGSMSVRGYGFEQLSNNDVGSNSILTASAEAEYRFLNSWSGAVFYDIGNAFNDWNQMELKRGAGVGLRWYSIAGEIRVDVARALDFEDKPWRLHITIGTPLL